MTLTDISLVGLMVGHAASFDLALRGESLRGSAMMTLKHALRSLSHERVRNSSARKSIARSS
jgi:hypothetical protein